jgi:hypothetical protein
MASLLAAARNRQTARLNGTALRSASAALAFAKSQQYQDADATLRERIWLISRLGAKKHDLPAMPETETVGAYLAAAGEATPCRPCGGVSPQSIVRVGLPAILSTRNIQPSAKRFAT